MYKNLFIAFFCTFLTMSVYAKTLEATMNNLNQALKGETNASHKYELFAKKADAEGYKQVAKLFRAVSMAESIHRNNHKATILSLGGKPDVVNYDSVKIGTTKENLQVPVKGEAYEKEVMYPNFIKQAKVDNMPDAVKTFTFAENAEKQHEKLFEDALNNLGKNKPVDYCVSKITGATYAKDCKEKCPSGNCGEEKEYIRIKDN
jgi:rubrerythrin